MKQSLLLEEEEVSLSHDIAKETIQKYLPINEFDRLYFDKRQYLYREGNPSEGLHIIISGKIKASIVNNGKEQILRIASEKDYLGYECVMCSSRYCMSSVALIDTETAFVPRDIFDYLMQTKVELARAFAELLSVSLIKKDKRRAKTNTGSVRGRLANALLELQNIFHDNNNGVIVLSRGELASYVGSVRETITRLLSEFKQDELIETCKGGIRVIDRRKLIALSNLF